MTKERSRAYPSLDLKVAITKLTNVSKNLGNGSFAKDEVILGMGYKSVSGSSQRALAALGQYGLIEKSKGIYSVSGLGRSILFPEDDQQQASAIKDAALTPPIFKELTDQYSSQGLPELQFLANILASPRYGIGIKQKDEVAHTYVDTMRFAGLLQGNILEPVAEVDQDEARIDNPDATTSAPTNNNGNENAKSPDNYSGKLGTSQGVSLSGEGWSLEVSIKTISRIPASARTKVRELLDSADALADELYAVDEQDEEK